MAYLTEDGENFLLNVIGGQYAAAYTAGYNRMGIYGSVGGAADALIDTPTAIVWSLPGTVANLNTSPTFTVTANTVVKGVLIFNSVLGVTLGDQLVQYDFETPVSYTNAGTFQITACSYNFDRVDI